MLINFFLDNGIYYFISCKNNIALKLAFQNLNYESREVNVIEKAFTYIAFFIIDENFVR